MIVFFGEASLSGKWVKERFLGDILGHPCQGY